MSFAILIHGPIGSGKTTACLSLVERIRAEGVTVCGIVSIRFYQDGELNGYNGLDLKSGEAMPLVRLRSKVEGSDWFEFSNLKYVFSAQGFSWANKVLILSVEAAGHPLIVFIDEFGRLEKAGLGVYSGALKVVEKLEDGGITIFTCRDDIIDTLENFLKGKADVLYICKPRESKSLWRTIQKYVRTGIVSKC